MSADASVRSRLLRGGIAVVVVAAAFAVSRLIGVVVLTSGSMEPMLGVGDLAVYRRGGEARSQEVVLYRKAGWPRGVVHRVVGVLPDGSLLTRGDANPVADREPVRPDAVIGRVVLVVPSGKALRAVARLR